MVLRRLVMIRSLWMMTARCMCGMRRWGNMWLRRRKGKVGEG